MPILDIVIPQMGEGLREVLVQKLFKKPGEFVKRDEPIYAMETDKAEFEVESPYDGTLTEWFVEEGEALRVGALIARIEVPAGEVVRHSPAQSADVSKSTGPTETPASAQLEQSRSSARSPAFAQVRTNIFIPPRTRAYCGKLAVSDEEIAGIPAASGTLMPSDVDRYLAEKSESSPPSDMTPEAQTPTSYEDRRLPARQRVLNFRLKRSAQLVVPGTMVRKVDWQRFEAAVQALGRRNPGVPSSDFDAFAYAVAQATKHHPEFRSVLVGEETVREFEYLNLGIAVQHPSGQLLTAVVPKADRLDFASFAATVQHRIRLALEGEDQVGEQVPVHLNYVGSLEVTDGTPILVSPAIAVVFLGAPTGRPPDRTANLGVTFDHRLISGVGAASFLASVVCLINRLGAEDAGVPEETLTGPIWSTATVSELHDAEGAQQQLMLEKLIIEQVAAMIEVAPEDVDPREPLRTLGLSSRMAVDLTNRLAMGLRQTLPATLLWTYPTIVGLAGYLSDQVSKSSVSTLTRRPKPNQAALQGSTILDKLERLSEEEAESLLREKIEGEE